MSLVVQIGQQLVRQRLAVAGLAIVVVTAGLSWPSRDPASLLFETEQALKAGQLDRAETLLTKLGRVTPRPALADWFAADLAEAEGEPDQVLAHLGRIGPHEALAGKARVRAARQELKRNHASRAERLLTEALAFNPLNTEARQLRAQLYNRQGRSRALADDMLELAAVETLSPEDWIAWARASLGLEPVGDCEERVDDLFPFIEADPADVRSSVAIAHLLMRLGRFNEAVDLLADFHDRVPDVLNTRAEIAMAVGDLDRADSLLRRGSEQHPATNRLRGRLALLRDDPSLALTHLELAEAFEPGRLDVASDRLKAVRSLGSTIDTDLVRAMAEKRQALASLLGSLSPSIDEVERIASVAEFSGHDQLARAGFALALENRPNDTALQAAVRRLDARIAGLVLTMAEPSAHLRPYRPSDALR
jgi:tetratricopeptide (TPR) repeat protein